MFTMAVVAALTLGELQGVQVGDGMRVRRIEDITLRDPLGQSLAQETTSAEDRVSLTLTFGPTGGVDVVDVRAVKMLPGQKHLRVTDVSAALDVASLVVVDPENPGRVQLVWSSLLMPSDSTESFEASLVGERVEVLSPGGPFGYDRLEGILLGTGERRMLAVGDDVHVLGDATLIVPGGMTSAVRSPTLDLQLAQSGAAQQLALGYYTRGASYETRYTLDLHDDGTASLEQRVGVYLAEGTAFPEAEIEIVFAERNDTGAPAVLGGKKMRLVEGETVWRSIGSWQGLSIHQTEDSYTIDGAGILDSWLPPGRVLIRHTADDGLSWTVGSAPLSLTAPGAEIVLPLR